MMKAEDMLGDDVLDNDLRNAMSTAVTDEPPLERGPDAVFGAARRIGLRRQVGGVLVGLTTIALVLSVGLLAGGSRSGHGGTVISPGAAPAPSPAVSPKVTVSWPITPSEKASLRALPHGSATPDLGYIPAATMLATLKSLLPAGVTTSADDAQPGYAGLDVGDGNGKVRLEINVQPQFDAGRGSGPAPSVQIFNCAWRESDPVGTTCHLNTLTNGTRVLTTDGPDEDSRAHPARQRSVDTITVGDLRIAINQWNAVSDKTGPVTRPTMLLTTAQMTAIALSPLWQ
jgi:hypothetical protein